MKPGGILLAVLGIAAMLSGFGMDGAAPGERVLNIGLLNQKLMLVVAGGAGFIAGVVLFGAAEIADVLVGTPHFKRKVDGASDAAAADVGAPAPGEAGSYGEAWRKNHTIVRSILSGGRKVYFLSDQTVAVQGFDLTYPDLDTALKATKL